MKPQSVLLRAGDVWGLKSVVAHFWDSMQGGRYISAFDTPSSDFMVANDAVLRGPMSIEDVWGAINSEPLILIYA